MRLLILSTLFPDADRPRLGNFVEAQTLALAKRPDIEVRVIAPRRSDDGEHQPEFEDWRGLCVCRPAFVSDPAARHCDADRLATMLVDFVAGVCAGFPFDIIAAERFWPDGPAAIRLGQAFGVPVTIKARGNDIHLGGKHPVRYEAILAAAQAANGLRAVSGDLRNRMIALGMPATGSRSITTAWIARPSTRATDVRRRRRSAWGARFC